MIESKDLTVGTQMMNHYHNLEHHNSLHQHHELEGRLSKGSTGKKVHQDIEVPYQNHVRCAPIDQLGMQYSNHEVENLVQRHKSTQNCT